MKYYAKKFAISHFPIKVIVMVDIFLYFYQTAKPNKSGQELARKLKFSLLILAT